MCSNEQLKPNTHISKMNHENIDTIKRNKPIQENKNPRDFFSSHRSIRAVSRQKKLQNLIESDKCEGQICPTVCYDENHQYVFQKSLNSSKKLNDFPEVFSPFNTKSQRNGFGKSIFNQNLNMNSTREILSKNLNKFIPILLSRKNRKQ